MAIKLCPNGQNNSDYAQCITFSTSGAIPTSIEENVERDFFMIEIPFQYGPMAEDFQDCKTTYRISGVLVDIPAGNTIAQQKTILLQWFAGGNAEGTVDPQGAQNNGQPFYLFSDAPFNEGGGTTGASNGVPVYMSSIRFNHSADMGPNQIGFELNLFRVHVT